MKLMFENTTENAPYMNFNDYDPWYELFDRLCDAVAEQIGREFTLKIIVEDEYENVIGAIDISGDEDGMTGY